MTRDAFLAAYERQLVATYEWAADVEQRARFMDKVRETLTTDRSPWAYDGPCTTAAWREIGGKGKPTRKALRALP